MAFTVSNLELKNSGSFWTATGSYTNTSGSTGGSFATGLSTITSFSSSNNTQSATTNQVSISGGTVTLTTIANEDGTWVATGY